MKIQLNFNDLFFHLKEIFNKSLTDQWSGCEGSKKFIET
jgi:hypothetical protein